MLIVIGFFEWQNKKMVKEQRDFDIAVIGAGVIGCAIARRLKQEWPDKSIVVLEKAPNVASETSRFNSGVLHSGIHENPNFLKFQLAKIGYLPAKNYLMEKKLPALNCGMLVAVSRKSLASGFFSEWKSLLRFFKKAKTKEIEYKIVFGKSLSALEPNIKALGGIFLPEITVIDPVFFTETLQQDAKILGTKFLFNNTVKRIAFYGSSAGVKTDQVEFLVGAIINCAGLYADEVSAMAGFDKYKIYPWRGEYYEIVGAKSQLTRRLIYVATPPPGSGKGIHFSPRPNGRLYLGPNARPVPTKNYYQEDKTPIKPFLEVARRFFPSITENDLRWGYSGIRPRLTPDSHQEKDFVIKMENEKPPFVNLVGIESPGFAASLAIANHVLNLLKKLP